MVISLRNIWQKISHVFTILNPEVFALKEDQKQKLGSRRRWYFEGIDS